MRRTLGVVLITALGVALSHPAASAASLAAPTYDFRSAVFMRVFGETGDPAASVAAAYGDRGSESPLRAVALRLPGSQTADSFTVNLAAAPTFAESPDVARADGYIDLAQTVRSRVLNTNVLYSAPVSPRAETIANAADSAPSTFPIAAYQPVAEAPDVSLQSGEVSFGPIAPPQSQSLVKSSASGVAGAAATTKSIPALLRVGPVNVQGQVQNDSAQAPQLALHDNSYGAGADVAVRAGRRNLDVGLSSSYEQLTRNDNFAPSGPAASLSLPGADTSLVIPNTANLSRLSIGAGVAVPLINGLTLNLNYDTARLLGSYGLPGLTNLDAIDNAYGGGLTFALPHSSSFLSFSAYQSHYQDNILPANSSLQTRENLNFTVKF